MARYTINYLDGRTEDVNAENAECDVDARLFIFHGHPSPVALIPCASVRSIHRHNEAVTS